MSTLTDSELKDKCYDVLMIAFTEEVQLAFATAVQLKEQEYAHLREQDAGTLRCVAMAGLLRGLGVSDQLIETCHGISSNEANYFASSSRRQ